MSLSQSIRRHEPVDVVADMKLILQYVTMLGMMTNDPLILAYYRGRLQHTALCAYSVAHYARFIRPRKQA